LCIDKVAKETRNSEYCSKVLDISARNRCYESIARLTENIELCDYLEFDDTILKQIEREECIISVKCAEPGSSLGSIKESDEKVTVTYPWMIKANNGDIGLIVKNRVGKVIRINQIQYTLDTGQAEIITEFIGNTTIPLVKHLILV